MKVKILMVCLGNICLSPLAEGILKSKLPTDKFIVDFLQELVRGMYDLQIHAQSQLPNKKILIFLSKRDVSLHDFNDFDYIYVMDNRITMMF
jgi:protein-tyrosine phosphatase